MAAQEIYAMNDEPKKPIIHELRANDFVFEGKLSYGQESHQSDGTQSQSQTQANANAPRDAAITGLENETDPKGAA